MKDTKNPQAFPRSISIQTDSSSYTSISDEAGMTLRDYFAAKAMQALIATPEAMQSAGMDRNPNEMRSHIAEMCYEISDAMLQAREKAQ